jgi:acyl carrier protein
MQDGLAPEKLRTIISRIICETLEITPAALEQTQNLRQLESVDSINLVRVIARIEEQFDVVLDDDLVFEVTTLDELVSAVARLATSHTV